MGYRTEIRDGQTLRFKTWREGFLDEDTGKTIYINRAQIIKVNGVLVNQFGTTAKVIYGLNGKQLWPKPRKK